MHWNAPLSSLNWIVTRDEAGPTFSLLQQYLNNTLATYKRPCEVLHRRMPTMSTGRDNRIWTLFSPHMLCLAICRVHVWSASRPRSLVKVDGEGGRTKDMKSLSIVVVVYLVESWVYQEWVVHCNWCKFMPRKRAYLRECWQLKFGARDFYQLSKY